MKQRIVQKETLVLSLNRVDWLTENLPQQAMRHLELSRSSKDDIKTLSIITMADYGNTFIDYDSLDTDIIGWDCHIVMSPAAAKKQYDDCGWDDYEADYYHKHDYWSQIPSRQRTMAKLKLKVSKIILNSISAPKASKYLLRGHP